MRNAYFFEASSLNMVIRSEIIVWKQGLNESFLHYKWSSKSFLELSIYELAWNFEETWKQFVKRLPKYFVLNLRLSLENCQFLTVIFLRQLNLFFGYQQRIMRTVHTGGTILIHDRVISDTLKSQIKHQTLYNFELDCPQKLIRRMFLSRLFLINCTFH